MTLRTLSQIALGFQVLFVVYILASRYHDGPQNLVSEEFSLYHSFLPRGYWPRRSAARLKGRVEQEYTSYLPPQCDLKEVNVPQWRTCDPAALCPVDKRRDHLSYPRHTVWGEASATFFHRVLDVAWGKQHPTIDLYVRTGCGGAREMRILLESVVLFWPPFLGEILLVLDYGNHEILQEIIPVGLRKYGHQFRVVYEHCPCMKGRFFNQFSYLTCDRHSNAEYIVTIDSDCTLHTPVTPQVLFNSKGELILPTSRIFQRGSWNFDQMFITQIDNGPYGHAMVSQPVSFAHATFHQYRAWIQKTRGTCLEDLISDLINTTPKKGFDFCWMCQLNVFLGHHNRTGYDLHDIDTRRDPYFRFAIHTSYELDLNASYVDSAAHIIHQGLCFWAADAFGAVCNIPVTYFEKQVFDYASADMCLACSPNDKKTALQERQHLFVRAIEQTTRTLLS